MPSTGSTATSALKAAPGRPKPLAALRLRRLAARGLADRHHGVDIDVGQRGPHGVERRTAGVLAVAPADPVEGGTGGGLRHAAEGKNELRIGRTVSIGTP